MRKIYACAILIIVFVVFTIVSCRKESSNSDNQIDEITEIRDWLHSNGKNYKNELIKVLAPSGNIEEGHLDWSKTNKYDYFGKQYMEIPFVFSNNKTILIGNDTGKIGGVAFTLVVRKDSLGNYEGASRSTIYGNTMLAVLVMKIIVGNHLLI